MADTAHYVIRGGEAGRERLRLLSRVMHASTSALLDRLALVDGDRCLDAGCGGGDVTLEIARRVAPGGAAVGLDLDEVKLAMARDESRRASAPNVSFVQGDVAAVPGAGGYDAVYARFLLTHLRDPLAAVRAFHDALRPGGRLAVEDIDFDGCFAWPDSAAHRRYWGLYCTSVRRRGGDPCIGPRLPALLREAGFEVQGVAVAQPVGVRGEVKQVSTLTLENIAEVAIAEGLATREEIDRLLLDMVAYAQDESTLCGLPRIVQAWARRPQAGRRTP